MSLGLSGLLPELQPWAEYLVRALRESGYRVQVTSVYRSPAAQARLYRRFLAGESMFPAAPPGRSTHEWRIAFDLKIDPSSGYAIAGRIWESWGGRWGGRFSDPIHFDARA